MKKAKDLHPGSSTKDAKAVGGSGDFGVAESNVAERTYTSRNTKMADPGAAHARSGDSDSRTSGAGGANSGVGSSSGGDLDTDIIGIGTGIGIAASGNIDQPAGPDDSTGGSDDFASGGHAAGKHQNEPLHRVRAGSVVQLADDRTTSAAGADASANSDAGDDASAGEISADEARGRNDAGN